MAHLAALVALCVFELAQLRVIWSTGPMAGLDLLLQLGCCHLDNAVSGARHYISLQALRSADSILWAIS